MTLEYGREPKNPALAESGEGWALSTTGTSGSSGLRFRASRPQSTATSGPPRAASTSIARWVMASQPLPRCEPGEPGWTVSTLLSSSTPWVNHGLRSPLGGGAMPRSSLSSLYMLRSEAGSGVTSGPTENDSPTG